jgi:hypothetical protein
VQEVAVDPSCMPSCKMLFLDNGNPCHCLGQVMAPAAKLGLGSLCWGLLSFVSAASQSILICGRRLCKSQLVGDSFTLSQNWPI